MTITTNIVLRGILASGIIWSSGCAQEADIHNLRTSKRLNADGQKVSDHEKEIAPLGDILGLITKEKSATAFKAKSVYGEFHKESNQLIIKISASEDRDTLFRAVDRYECVPCGKNDEHACDSSNEGETLSPYMILGISEGFPGKDELALPVLPELPAEPADDATAEELAQYQQDLNAWNNVNFSRQDSGLQTLEYQSGYDMTDSTAVGASIKFERRPTKINDSFKADIKVTVSGKAYSATVAGKVYTYPKQPDLPSCAFNETIRAIYND